MLTVAAIPLTLWLAVLVARPRRPLPGNDVAELVYARLLGRQQRLALLAFGATAALFLALFIALPPRVNAELMDLRRAHQACGGVAHGVATCAVLRPDGTWALNARQGSGAWTELTPILAPAPFVQPADAPMQ